MRAIEIEIAGAKDTLATKQDLSEIRQEIQSSRTEMTAQMSTQRGELKAEIHASASAVTRQMYAAILGQMAVLLGFAYFFAMHLR